MKFYEGMFIIDSAISEEEIQQNIQELEGYITSEGGEITEKELIGKRKLEAKIGKRAEGYYVLLFFKVKPSGIVAINHKCRLNANILRYVNFEADMENVVKFADLNRA